MSAKSQLKDKGELGKGEGKKSPPPCPLSPHTKKNMQRRLWQQQGRGATAAWGDGRVGHRQARPWQPTSTSTHTHARGWEPGEHEGTSLSVDHRRASRGSPTSSPHAPPANSLSPLRLRALTQVAQACEEPVNQEHGALVSTCHAWHTPRNRGLRDRTVSGGHGKYSRKSNKV